MFFFSNIHSHIVKVEHTILAAVLPYTSKILVNIYMHFKTSTSNVAYRDLLKYCWSVTEANIITGDVQ